jgi:hypothetical protein
VPLAFAGGLDHGIKMDPPALLQPGDPSLPVHFAGDSALHERRKRAVSDHARTELHDARNAQSSIARHTQLPFHLGDRLHARNPQCTIWLTPLLPAAIRPLSITSAWTTRKFPSAVRILPFVTAVSAFCCAKHASAGESGRVCHKPPQALESFAHAEFDIGDPHSTSVCTLNVRTL